MPKVQHLNNLSQEKRKHILERFFASWAKEVEPTSERNAGYIRSYRELNITGTDDPTYTYEPIDDWNVKLTLTIQYP